MSSGRTKSVIFDLFGTLVPAFPRVEHDEVLDECSALVALDARACRDAWRELYVQRVRGEVGGIAGHLGVVAERLGRRLDAARVELALARYRRFADTLVHPVSGAVDVLDELSARGVSLGLLSNSHPDIAAAFDRSPLAPCFEAAVFSCEVGAAKPDAGAYDVALGALGMAPADALFVGDGSDEELSGAVRAGMTAVLLRIDASGSYDPQRSDVQSWEGPAVDTLGEIVELVAP